MVVVVSVVASALESVFSALTMIEMTLARASDFAEGLESEVMLMLLPASTLEFSPTEAVVLKLECDSKSASTTPRIETVVPPSILPSVVP